MATSLDHLSTNQGSVALTILLVEGCAALPAFSSTVDYAFGIVIGSGYQSSKMSYVKAEYPAEVIKVAKRRIADLMSGYCL